MTLYALGALLLICVAGAAYLATLVGRLRFEVAARTAENSRVALTLAEAEIDRADLRRKLTDSELGRERLAATLESERKSAAERLDFHSQAEQSLRDAFGSLSKDALTANNNAFLDLARSLMHDQSDAAKTDFDSRRRSIDDLIAPVHDSLRRVDAKLGDFDRERAAAASALTEMLKGMAGAQKSLLDETALLVRALRTPQVRGQWGEMQLRRTVELAGMQEHCDFDLQVTVVGDEGRNRPDLVVHVPGGRTIVVDSKTPMDAYLAALQATTDEDKARLIDQHARQVRSHIRSLADKDYSSLFDKSPDLVVLFLPSEPLLSAACQQDADIIEYAAQLGIIPATPTTLIALLKAAAFGWHQERVSDNAQEIRNMGAELYQRVRVLVDHLTHLRKHLHNTVEYFNKTVGSMDSRVIPAARRLKELGAGPGEEVAELKTVDLVPRLIAEDTAA